MFDPLYDEFICPACECHDYFSETYGSERSSSSSEDEIVE
jgi:hypothetical protein